MNALKNILDSILQSHHQNDNWKLHLIRNWPTIIGNLHDKICLQKINQNSLVIGVYDSSWIQELYLLSKLILQKINSSLDQPRIQTLRFQCIQQLSHTKSDRILQTRQAERKLQTITLKPQESIALQKIKDPLLAQAMQSFLQKCRC